MNQFVNRQWEQRYANHKKTVQSIEHRHYKFPEEVTEILQRQKEANKKVQNSQIFKQKETLSRITASNQILSKKLQEIEKRRQNKFIDVPAVRLSTKSLREEVQNKIKNENHKQIARLTSIKGTLQTQ